jgi:hypothetical protein
MSMSSGSVPMTCDRDVSALLVIDPYNDFISEGGKVWRSRGRRDINP